MEGRVSLEKRIEALVNPSNNHPINQSTNKSIKNN